MLSALSSAFNCDHNLHWGRLYEAEDVDIEWHSMSIHIVNVLAANFSKVPNANEVAFVLEVLEKISRPALDKVELLLAKPRWDNVDRNDFCR